MKFHRRDYHQLAAIFHDLLKKAQQTKQQEMVSEVLASARRAGELVKAHNTTFDIERFMEEVSHGRN